MESMYMLTSKDEDGDVRGLLRVLPGDCDKAETYGAKLHRQVVKRAWRVQRAALLLNVGAGISDKPLRVPLWRSDLGDVWRQSNALRILDPLTSAMRRSAATGLRAPGINLDPLTKFTDCRIWLQAVG
jgi:hypothetical protein